MIYFKQYYHNLWLGTCIILQLKRWPVVAVAAMLRVHLQMWPHGWPLRHAFNWAMGNVNDAECWLSGCSFSSNFQRGAATIASAEMSVASSFPATLTPDLKVCWIYNSICRNLGVMSTPPAPVHHPHFHLHLHLHHRHPFRALARQSLMMRVGSVHWEIKF